MLRTFSKWCMALLFGLGLTATAHADWNGPGFGHGGVYQDGGFAHDGGYGHEGYGYGHDGYGSSGCIDPCNDDCCWKNGCFGLQIDALSWTARQDDLRFGVKSVGFSETSSDSTTSFVGEKGLHPRTRWDAGFRVGLHFLQKNEWDVSVVYTRFNTNSSKSVGSSPGTNNIETIILDIDDRFADTFQQAHASWRLDVNYIDIDFARTISCGSCLKVTPHFGARAFWMEQQFRIRGETFAGVGTATVNNLLTARTKQHFWGYGVEGGLWANMNLGCGVSLVGHFGGSILYSKFNIRGRGFERTFSTAGPETEVFVATKDNIHTATPTLDYFVGLEYWTCCCGSDMGFRAGWEQHVYFNTNRFSECCGNLSLQGLTFSALFDF